jgi:hypothetical protein
MQTIDRQNKKINRVTTGIKDFAGRSNGEGKPPSVQVGRSAFDSGGGSSADRQGRESIVNLLTLKSPKFRRPGGLLGELVFICYIGGLEWLVGITVLCIFYAKVFEEFRNRGFCLFLPVLENLNHRILFFFSQNALLLCFIRTYLVFMFL